MERDRGLDPLDHHFLQRALQPHDAALSRAAIDDQLGDHRIVIRRDAIAGIDPAIDAHMHAACRVIAGHHSGRGGEVERVLGVDAAFDRMAGELDVLLLHRQRLARRDPDLLAHQVEAGDGLGHRMLDLQSGVHLDEVELAVFPQELDRARAAIAHVGHGLGADAAHAFPLARADHGRGGFLQHLLVAALQRAVAFPQMDRMTLAVAEHLEFDVARIAEIFLDIDGVVAECRLRFGPRRAHQRGQFGGVVDHLHAAPAAATGRLDQHRIADFLGQLQRFLGVFDRAVAARHQRQAQRARGALGLDLVAHGADMLGLGPDPRDVMRLDDFGEAGVFGQEAIAGMDRVCARDLCRRDDRGDVEIAFAGRRGADADRVVGKAHMHRIGIGGGMHRDGLDAHFPCGAVHAQRDFAPVGDQDTLDGHDQRLAVTRSRQAAGRIRPGPHCRPGWPKPCPNAARGWRSSPSSPRR